MNTLHMKILLTLLSFFTLTLAWGQSEPIPCNELPVAVPQTKATCKTSDLQAHFEKQIPDSMKRGEYNAVYKLFVDCAGTVKSVAYQRGSLSESDQKKMTEILTELSWNPAQDKGKPATSTVFITLEIVNGKCTVTVQ